VCLITKLLLKKYRKIAEDISDEKIKKGYRKKGNNSEEKHITNGPRRA
jgi:hypothetical protein